MRKTATANDLIGALLFGLVVGGGGVAYFGSDGPGPLDMSECAIATRARMMGGAGELAEVEKSKLCRAYANGAADAISGNLIPPMASPLGY